MLYKKKSACNSQFRIDVAQWSLQRCWLSIFPLPQFSEYNLKLCHLTLTVTGQLQALHPLENCKHCRKREGGGKCVSFKGRKPLPETSTASPHVPACPTQMDHWQRGQEDAMTALQLWRYMPCSTLPHRNLSFDNKQKKQKKKTKKMKGWLFSSN